MYNSTLKGNISGNTIKNCQKTAIYAGGTPINGDITNNTIKSVKGHGIGIYHGSHVNAIDSNNMDDIGGANNGGNGDCGIMINADEGSGKKHIQLMLKALLIILLKMLHILELSFMPDLAAMITVKPTRIKHILKKT